ncbi:hypothetical protein [Photobacterium sp. OFAV2-7]|uniref:hypothetical protein n=1 Tax=Photobacterium sp. OFAV2-7 TaxID=2917748 RepID=UPI001EF5CFEB|nr:hypothetical protein [Photobacterium sp. OFAV2-7]MCG7587471.1 hypothetical protein [Photobacterium sp. OFAV2-7]
MLTRVLILFSSLSIVVPLAHAEQTTTFRLNCNESRNFDLKPNPNVNYQVAISGTLGKDDGKLSFMARNGGFNAKNVSIVAIKKDTYWTTIQARIENTYIGISYNPSSQISKIDTATFEFEKDTPFLVGTDFSMYKNCSASGL